MGKKLENFEERGFYKVKNGRLNVAGEFFVMKRDGKYTFTRSDTHPIELRIAENDELLNSFELVPVKPYKDSPTVKSRSSKKKRGSKSRTRRRRM